MAAPDLDNDALLPPLPASLQTLWSHQEAPVRRITEMFQQGARMVVLDAPPGTGKTLVAESVRRNLKVRALYLTQTKQLQEQVCVGPDTQILAADFRWIRAGDLVPGDAVLGFDEQQPIGQRRRQWIPTVVEAVQIIRRRSHLLTLKGAPDVLCSSDHQWLIGSFRENGALRASLRWTSTHRLRAADERGRGTSNILRLFQPGAVISETERGMLSGDLAWLGGAEVLHKENMGEQSVVAITTTSGTYVAEGLASHNCRTFP